MAHAEKCPVCFGKGENEISGEIKFCHGCNGKGWVEVGTEYPNNNSDLEKRVEKIEKLISTHLHNYKKDASYCPSENWAYEAFKSYFK